jgi:peptidoglycan/xylan/chitin deacetylase (PgdA/CDA1 family)
MRHAALMFHAIQGAGGQLAGRALPEEAFYHVTGDFFRACLDRIESSRLVLLTSRSVAEGLPHQRGVFLTFDDGRESDYRIAFPEILRRKLRAVFFVTSDWIDTPGFVSAAGLREMVAGGMDVQAHGATHRFLTELNNRELRAELTNAKAHIEDVAGAEVTALSYPGGRGDERVRQIATECGYRMFFGSCPGWFRGVETEIPRLVVHGNSRLSSVGAYLDGDVRSIFRQRSTYYLGRGIRRLIGPQRYAALKDLLGSR